MQADWSLTCVRFSDSSGWILLRYTWLAERSVVTENCARVNLGVIAELKNEVTCKAIAELCGMCGMLC